MAAGSKGVVIAAMIANGGIAILKFIGFLLTGSPSMLAETYHSISDTGNQVLLLIGIRYSKRDASSVHPFGYGKARFFYAFLVSVLLFGVAGWESLKHGISKLRGGHHGKSEGGTEFLGFTIEQSTPFGLEPFQISVLILLGGIVFEVYAFWKARAELKRQMKKYDWSGYKEAFRETSDLTTLTAFTEDFVALMGLIVALIGITLAKITGNEAFDAAGAIVIGVLLMGFALALGYENKRLILGESLSDHIEEDLKAVMANQEGVVHVDDLRSMFIGTGRVLVTADVSFDTGLSTADIDQTIETIEQKLEEADSRVKVVYVEPET